MSVVARVQTTPTIIEWRDAISAAWLDKYGTAPTLKALSVLWAQFALETGRGAKCYCWNLGNIMPGAGWIGDEEDLPTWEQVNGRRVDIVERFRAFTTLAEGARNYLDYLGRASYAKAWACVVAGDAAGFARALKALGYYTADVTQYANGLFSLASEFLRAATVDAVTAAEVAANECLLPADFELGSVHADLAATLLYPTCHDLPSNDNSPDTKRSAA